MVALLEKMAHYAADPSKGQSQLMIERGIGYWITDDGEYVPTPPRVSHGDLVRHLIDADTLSEDDREAFTIDANAYAISKGWTRVRIYPSQSVVYIDYGAGKQKAHRRAVEELIDQLGLSGLILKYTDEQGNYISDT
ncbi:MAG: hypothetical protein WD042_16210 [Phycisphaeraceae bacterium]